MRVKLPSTWWPGGRLRASIFDTRAWSRLMWEQLKELASTNVFPVLSLMASGYFFYCFSVAVGLPPTQAIDSSSAAYLALAILFFTLPEVRKFQNTRLRETQAKLSEAKDEI